MGLISFILVLFFLAVFILIINVVSTSSSKDYIANDTRHTFLDDSDDADHEVSNVDTLSVEKNIPMQDEIITIKDDYIPYNKRYTRARKLTTNFTVIDFETTGLHAYIDEIIQIGAIKYLEGIEVDRFSTYIKPSIPVPPDASQINGITNEMLKNAPPLESVWEEFLAFIDNETLVAHNAKFDLSFLLKSSDELFIDIPKYRVIDTLPLARKYINSPNHKLVTLKKYLNINAKSHDALEDCVVTAEVFLYCFNCSMEIK